MSGGEAAGGGAADPVEAASGKAGGRPEAVLHRLAEMLREEDTPLSPYVVDPTEEPVLGPMAARGPRAAKAPAEYSLVVESVREGYLLHYGEPRLLTGQDEDLALLAGDYLYALGIERLAALGDVTAVHELADLISGCAQLHAEGRDEKVPGRWHRAVEAIAGDCQNPGPA